MTCHFLENFRPNVVHVFLGKFHYNFKSNSGRNTASDQAI